MTHHQIKETTIIPPHGDFHTEPAATYQVGGSHYQRFKIQPIDFIRQNDLNFCQGNVIKYVCRYLHKNGIEDLEKAKQYIDFLIEDIKSQTHE